MRTALTVAALLAAAPSFASEPASSHGSDARFDRLKTLAGIWKGKGGEAGAKESFEAILTYRVTGAGSALVETMGPGTEHEMITVYHLDGEDLVLTHYCAAGNQPTMRAAKGGAADSIAFDFLRASNLKAGAVHMHDARIRFVDGDHIVSEWTSWKDGKPSGTMRFELARQK